MAKTRKKRKTSFTLSKEAADQLEEKASRLGISKTATLEIMIRDFKR